MELWRGPLPFDDQSAPAFHVKIKDRLMGYCHGSTSSPSALSEEDSKGGVTVLEGSKVLARGTRSCT